MQQDAILAAKQAVSQAQEQLRHVEGLLAGLLSAEAATALPAPAAPAKRPTRWSDEDFNVLCKAVCDNGLEGLLWYDQALENMATPWTQVQCVVKLRNTFGGLAKALEVLRAERACVERALTVRVAAPDVLEDLLVSWAGDEVIRLTWADAGSFFDTAAQRLFPDEAVGDVRTAVRDWVTAVPGTCLSAETVENLLVLGRGGKTWDCARRVTVGDDRCRLAFFLQGQLQGEDWTGVSTDAQVQADALVRTLLRPTRG